MISNITYEYYQISFILIIAAFAIPLSRKASIVYIPILMLFGIIFGPVFGFINQSFALFLLSSFGTVGLGILGLVVILYYESHNINPKIISRYIYDIAALDTIGMVITAIGAGVIFSLITHVPFRIGFLFGAIISPTDPASLIPTFRRLSMRDDVSGTLIGESLFNDPLGIILLDVGIALIAPKSSYVSFFTIFSSHIGIIFGSIVFMILQMAIPAAIGIALGFIIIYLNRYFNFENFIIALTLGIVLFEFTSLTAFNITPFPAIIATGAIVGNYSDKSIFWNREMSFNENLSFMAQSIIFILLGSILTLKEMEKYLILGIIISVLVMLLVRPAAVFSSLTIFNFKRELIRFDNKTKAFMSLVGPRGIVPIVLSTVPYVVGIDDKIGILIKYGPLIYVSVSFVVLITIIVQTIYVPLIGKKLLGKK